MSVNRNYTNMEELMTRFRIVIPSPPKMSISTAELRIAPTRLTCSHVTAAELGYPEFVCLMVSDDATKIVIKASEQCEFSIPFYKPNPTQKSYKPIVINNKGFAKVVRKAMKWEEKGTYRVPAIRYTENGMLLFDLNNAERSQKHKDRVLTPEEIFDSYPTVNDVVNNYHMVSLPAVIR